LISWLLDIIFLGEINMSSGAFIDIGSEEMTSTKTMTAAMTSAGAKAAKYKAPHKK